MKVVGIVPASGASRRMGEPKALLELEGRTFAQRVVGALRDGGCARVVAVTSDDAAVSEAMRAADATVLHNAEPGDGPITSMRVALASLPADVDAVAWLPLDYPLVGAATVAALIDLAGTSQAPLALPLHERADGSEKRGHPAIFRRALFEEFMDPEVTGGARTIVHRHLAEAALLRTDDASVVTDVDTPEQYRSLLERVEAS